MITVMIEDNNVQTVEYTRTQPFTTVVEERKKSFEEACIECNGRPASDFFDELRYQVKKHFENA